MIHLVRHGESTWNAAGLLQGRTHAPGLTARGRDQARRAAAALAGSGADRILTSPQRRAAKTAAVLAEVLGLPVELCPELREQAHGSWEGRPAADCAAALAAAGPDWAPPGGETLREVHARAVRLLDRVPAGTVLVSHGETIRALLAAAAGLPVDDLPAAIPANGEVVTRPAPLASGRPA